MNSRGRVILLFPVAGILIFIVFYLLAVRNYPGGSQVDVHSVGFSWANNYWCNLLDKNAINGLENTGRPFAMAGMLVLVLTLAIFFYAVPYYSYISERLKRIISFSGIASVVSVLFLQSGSHDVVLNIAGVFGFVAFGGVVSIMRLNKWYGLAGLGIFNLVLVAINNLFYYNPGLIHLLPFVQKVTFLCFLFWISSICLKTFRSAASGRPTFNTP